MTYKTFEVFKSADLVVRQLQCCDVPVAHWNVFLSGDSHARMLVGSSPDFDSLLNSGVEASVSSEERTEESLSFR